MSGSSPAQEYNTVTSISHSSSGSHRPPGSQTRCSPFPSIEVLQMWTNILFRVKHPSSDTPVDIGIFVASLCHVSRSAKHLGFRWRKFQAHVPRTRGSYSTKKCMVQARQPLFYRVSLLPPLQFPVSKSLLMCSPADTHPSGQTT